MWCNFGLVTFEKSKQRKPRSPTRGWGLVFTGREGSRGAWVTGGVVFVFEQLEGFGSIIQEQVLGFWESGFRVFGVYRFAMLSFSGSRV